MHAQAVVNSPPPDPPPAAAGDAVVEFRRGQAVRWPPAPGGVAQVVELRRRAVRLFYRCHTGTTRQPIVPAARLAGLQANGQPPLPMHNVFGRAAMRGSRRYPVQGGPDATVR